MESTSSDYEGDLVEAVLRNDATAVKKLLEVGRDRGLFGQREGQRPDVEERRPILRDSDRRMDPLHAAVMKGYVEIAAALVESGFSDVNVRAEATSVNDFSMTPLHRAVLHQQPKAIERLLNLGESRQFRNGQSIK